MKGQTLETEHFGIYTEQKETDNLPQEFEGNVAVLSRGAFEAPFLFTTKGLARRYDLPEFMKKYDKKHVVVLARKFSKTVGEKIYHKLVVISVKVLANS